MQIEIFFYSRQYSRSKVEFYSICNTMCTDVSPSMILTRKQKGRPQLPSWVFQSTLCATNCFVTFRVITYTLFYGLRVDLHGTTLLQAASLRHEFFRVNQTYNSLTTILYAATIVAKIDRKRTHFVTNFYRVGDEGEVSLLQDGGRSCCWLIHMKSFLEKYWTDLSEKTAPLIVFFKAQASENICLPLVRAFAPKTPVQNFAYLIL